MEKPNVLTTLVDPTKDVRYDVVAYRPLTRPELLMAVRAFHAQKKRKLKRGEVVRIIIEGRKRRELDPTVAFLKECSAELARDSDTPRHAKAQINGQLEFMETLLGWYESIRQLPRSTLLKMMRMGQRIARIIGE